VERKEKRFTEKRKDISRQISVTFIQQFHPSKTYIGKLYDLSEKAVKVIIDKKHVKELLAYKPKTTLTKFRFSEDHKVTVSITSIQRVDVTELEGNKAGIVLSFEVISKEDASALRQIIASYAV
jgi:hypothetical protein